MLLFLNTKKEKDFNAQFKLYKIVKRVNLTNALKNLIHLKVT